MQDLDIASFIGGIYVGIALMGVITFVINTDKGIRNKIKHITVIGMLIAITFLQIFKS